MCIFFLDLVLTCIFAIVIFVSAFSNRGQPGWTIPCKQYAVSLSTLNLKTISDTNLKIMEQPAGEVIEQVATESARIAASDAILNEMT